MPRPILATISLSALTHNLGVVRRHAGSTRVWAVVKANGYGHGVARAARAFASADGLALLDIAEAARLRDEGVRHPILLLEGCFGYEDVMRLAEHGLTTVIHSAAQVELMEAAVLPSAVPIYLKLNTGLNRLGFAPDEARAIIERLRACRAVSGITLMTHYADADGSRGIAAQHRRFMETCDGLGMPTSSANSAALLRFPETFANAPDDWVRPGIMLYGCSPFAGKTAAQLDLRPAMTLTSEIIAVQALKKGDEVGYGGTFRAEKNMRIGIVACGYADGYPRHAASGAPILVDGARTVTVGRVSMDMLAVDLTSLPDAGIGSRVTLWGEGLDADLVARHAGTVSYQLLCALAPRVPVAEI